MLLRASSLISLFSAAAHSSPRAPRTTDTQVKFTPAGGSITVVAWADGDLLRCSVRDTGCGLTPEGIARLFRPFSQARLNSTHSHSIAGIAEKRARQTPSQRDMTPLADRSRINTRRLLCVALRTGRGRTNESPLWRTRPGPPSQQGHLPVDGRRVRRQSCLSCPVCSNFCGKNQLAHYSNHVIHVPLCCARLDTPLR